MAFTVTARHSGTTGSSSAQTLTTSSTTPTADSLLLVAMFAINDANTTAQTWQTPTGGSLTYVQVNESTDVLWGGTLPDFTGSSALYRAAIGSSPSAFAITVDARPGTENTYYEARSCDITGHDTVSPVVQAAVNSGTIGSGGLGSDTGSGTVTLASTPTPGNLLVVYIGASADSAGAPAAPTAGAGKTFTAIGTPATGPSTNGGLWYRICDGTESTTITCADLGQQVGNYGAHAVEIRIAGGAAPAVESVPLPRIAPMPLRRFRAPFETPFQMLGDTSAPLTLPATLAVPAGQIAIDGTAPVVTVVTAADPNQAQPGIAWMFLEPNAASFQMSGSVSIDPAAPATLAVPAGTVTITGTAPAISFGVGVTIAVPAGVLTASGTAPGVTAAASLTPPSGALAITGTAPAVTTGGGLDLAIPAGSSTITGTGPAVTAAVSIAAPAGQLTASGTAPAVSVGVGQSLAAPAGQVTISGTAPIVTVGGAFNTAVPAGAITIGGTAPPVTAAASITPPAGLISLNGTPPLITISGGTNVAVPAGLISIGATGPAVSAAVGVGAAAGSLSIRGTAPIVIMGVSQFPTISGGALTGDYLTGGTIGGDYLSGGALS